MDRALDFFFPPILGCALPLSYKDGYCNDENNNEACFFDGGDCCGPTWWNCTECKCLEDITLGRVFKAAGSLLHWFYGH